MRRRRIEIPYILCGFVSVQSLALPSIQPLTDKTIIERQIIVNGLTATRYKYPYVSSILVGSKHICGASLIAPDIVLSAAHCFQKSIAWDRLHIVVGEYHLQDLEDGGESFSVETMDFHPDYTLTPEYLENDAVVIKLSGESRKRIVKLDRNTNLFDMANDGDSFTVLGWGSIDVNGTIFANVLQEVTLGYITNDECKQRGIPVVTNQMICAVDLVNDGINQDSCYGDSGGPMILSNAYTSGDKKDIQVGIVSFGSKTCGTFPGVYTRISSVFDWIRDRVCVLSKNPPQYFRCDHFPLTTAPTSHDSINSTNIPSSSPTLQYELYQKDEDSDRNSSIFTISNYNDTQHTITNGPTPNPTGIPLTNKQTLPSQHDQSNDIAEATRTGTYDDSNNDNLWGNNHDERYSANSTDSIFLLGFVRSFLIASCVLFVLFVE
mmetsp:Transcript_3327/g.6230  ORF Transcript_3327/g.6230 Transcript_3327/m.6230 type:complete len:435 (+) Transcript_3327:258-1562(+)